MAGTITNGSAPITLSGVGEGVITSALAGTGNVVMQGPGTWTLANVAVPSGVASFDIQGGTLIAESNGTANSLGTAPVSLNGGTLGLSASAPATFTNVITLVQDSGI